MTKRLLTACVCICMLLTLLPATVLAANPTYYGIFIAGTEITDENCSNITNEFIKEGRVSYDPVTETLTWITPPSNVLKSTVPSLQFVFSRGTILLSG